MIHFAIGITIYKKKAAPGMEQPIYLNKHIVPSLTGINCFKYPPVLNNLLSQNFNNILKLRTLIKERPHYPAIRWPLC